MAGIKKASEISDGLWFYQISDLILRFKPWVFGEFELWGFAHFQLGCVVFQQQEGKWGQEQDGDEVNPCHDAHCHVCHIPYQGTLATAPK